MLTCIHQAQSRPDEASATRVEISAKWQHRTEVSAFDSAFEGVHFCEQQQLYSARHIALMESNIVVLNDRWHGGA
eukprot:5288515-Prymnesium_polylepis.1